MHVGSRAQSFYSACAAKSTSFDKLERVSNQTLSDLLEVPQRDRTGGTFLGLVRVMAKPGRGYCRDAHKLQPSH
jgi:hypothetical protein